MAINSFEQLCHKYQLNPLCSNVSNINANNLPKPEVLGERCMTNKHGQPDTKRKMTSPYLNGDKVHIISHVTEKRLVHKKTADFVSSFPLAVNIYKANSDEFKNCKKRTKKIKKSVLTLPNEPAPIPKTCTVSDMNDSEYCKETNGERKPRPKKKRQLKINHKISNGNEFYDRDAQYCSQLNIDLDCSSTDLFKNYTGIDSCSSKKSGVRTFGKHNVKAHDIWTLLRNVNRFEYQPSAPNSQESIAPLKKKKKSNKRKNTYKDTRFIETEEFAYISSFDLDNNSHSQSSLDRVTVIDTQDNLEMFDKLHENKNTTTNILKSEFRNTYKASNSSHADDTVDLNNKRDQMEITHKVNFESGPNGDDTQNVDVYLPKVSLGNKNRLAMLPLEQGNNEVQEDCSETTNINSNTEAKKSQNIAVVCNSPNSSRFKKAVTYMKHWNQKDNKKAVISKESLTVNKNKELKTENVTRGQNNLLPQQNIVRPRLLATMPSPFLAPKLTQADIKRRLANIKFPLVILGKDQTRSTINIPNYDYSQFSGLDKQIWPFMVSWNNSGPTFKGIDKSYVIDVGNSKKKRKLLMEHNNIKASLSSGRVIPNISNKQTTITNISLSSIKENINEPIEELKIKPTRLKDKVIKFVSGKNIGCKKDKKNPDNTQCNAIVLARCMDAETQTFQHKRENYKDSKTKSPVTKHPWARGKWASDFIDNVIKRIKRGVYYDQECKNFNKQYDCGMFNLKNNINNGSKETYTQTELPEIMSPADVTSKVGNEMNNVGHKFMSGFDEFSELEIETFTRNEIAIKHCIANVVVKFDIAVSNFKNNTITHEQLLTRTTHRLFDNQPTIYKYKNTLLNSILPAQLCTILPAIMSHIFDSEKNIDRLKLNNNNYSLSPIENYDKFDLNPSCNLPPGMKIQDGTFFDKIRKPTFNIKRMSFNRNISTVDNALMNCLPKITTKIMFYSEISPIRYLISNVEPCCPSKRQLVLSIKDRLVRNETQSCTTVQIYNFSEKAVVPAYKRFTLEELFKKISVSDKVNIKLKIPYTNFTIVFSNIGMLLSCVKEQISKESCLNDFYEEVKPIFNIQNRSILDVRNQPSSGTNMNKSEQIKTNIVISTSNKRNRRKRRSRRHRQCKSMSNITKNSSNTIILNNITGMDEFCEVLRGSAKTLLSVLDGSTEKKILLSLTEMKSWVTDITPSQAFLILMLCNKKETYNLERYRPMILQGIAVNRITRISELDMEIDVIERENVKLPQYEGITYLPASTENRDTLLDELCWIAKTTASDYQKPFDENSERLLKSLLQKRKKLNPSYLRVMARYVGLGLLKSSK